MDKVTPIRKRKADHIRINLENEVNSGLLNGLEKYQFIHEALPELNLATIDTATTLFGRKLSAPILISSMTGGTKEGELINRHLAEAAQAVGVAMGIGSQRAAIEDPSLSGTFSISRSVAPDIFLIANLGAVQLNYNLSLEHYRRAVDMLNADALCLHLNPLQEAVQKDGDTDFSDLLSKIESICKNIGVPVIVKEVGFGISERTAGLLAGCGVSAIDVAGAGGTSWTQVEMHRAPDDFSRLLAATFSRWGIPTAESILNVKKGAPDMIIFASGGLTNGLDIAKCIALGAKLGGMAGPFLKEAVVSTESSIELLKLVKKQIEVTMFAVGAGNIDSLHISKLLKL
jgi:isopentenyl-diphosphate delta-isomerase